MSISATDRAVMPEGAELEDVVTDVIADATEDAATDVLTLEAVITETAVTSTATSEAAAPEAVVAETPVAEVAAPEAPITDDKPAAKAKAEDKPAAKAKAAEKRAETAAAETAPVETAPAEDAADDEPSGPTFGGLGLAEQLVRKLGQNGVTTPFPIQSATIPDALAGKDILGRGRTGSGKTLAFGLPLLTKLAGGRTEKKHPRGLILTPTRELAMQVADALQPYGDVVGLKMKVVCGGTSMSNQMYALERGVDILVATPGRLRDIINRGAASLDNVEIAVLDEADQMADMGFLPEVTDILDQVPAGGQRLLFSATLEHEIDSLVKRYLVSPVTHEVDAAQGAVTTMSHHVLVVKPKDKAPVTAAIAARKGRTIIFVRTQMGADRIAEQLVDAGVRADALHGGMTQGSRTRVLADFKEGQVNCLVATDVAARGIHVDDIDLVLNVDPAGDHKDYLHRSGRTARAGRSGTVVSLALPHQRKQIFRLMEDAGVDASRHIVGGGGAFDEDVALITGARSLTEVQAESAGNSAKQAEREVSDLTRQLEKAQRRATELREDADRLVARAARERGEDPEVAIAAAAEAATAELEAEKAAAAAVPAQSSHGGGERRDERGSYDRRDRRDDRPSGGSSGGRSFERRDDRSSGGGFNRDRRDDRPSGGSSGGRSFERRDDRSSGGGFNRNSRDDRSGGGFNRSSRDERPSGGSSGGRSYERRDDRSSGGGFNRNSRDDRPSGGSSGGRSYERRDERPSGGGYNRDRRDDRSGGGYGGGASRPFERREHSGYRTGGGDRPVNRDRRDDRPLSRDRRDERPARRDDHRGGTGSTSSTGSSTGARSFDRRTEKPRWKRNG